MERPSNAEVQDHEQDRELEPSNNQPNPRTNSELPKEPGLYPPDALPLLPEDAASMQPSILKEVSAEQRSGNARTVHLPPKEVQEKRFEELDQETDDGSKDRALYVDKDHASAHDFIPPSSAKDAERHASEENGLHGNNQPRPTGVLKSQMDIVRDEALGGAASTPDEQLRLEEAQSMQISKSFDDTDEKGSQSMPPPASLSSGFVHDIMVGGDALSGIPGVSEETNVKEDTRAHHAQTTQLDVVEEPTAGLRDHMLPGMSSDASRDLTLSRRPPMRIDTGVLPVSDSTSAAAAKSNAMTMPTPAETATPNKTTPAIGSVHPPPERMTTRVSSGALRHKSVSEILGETPKATPTSADKGPFTRESGDFHREDQLSLQTPNSTSSFASLDPATFKQRLSEVKERERSKLSTVVFSSSRNSDATLAQSSGEDEFSQKDRDYMLTLFHAQAASPPKAYPLTTLVKGAHKTLSTADYLTDFYERQAIGVLNRIYELQARSCWSLRQLERSAEPTRQVTHRDVLLGEMKWLRTDFREERKWRLAAAKFTADACAVWVAGNSEERKSLQVKARIEPAQEKSRSNSVNTPDLVHSGDDETSDATDDECMRDPGSAPAAIFSLPPEMFVFGLNKSPMAEKLLLELPLYHPGAEVKNAALLSVNLEPDAAWKKALVPVSKYAQGKIVSTLNSAPGRVLSTEEGPPRKRSRFDYYHADIRRANSGGASDVDSEKVLAPEQEDVALFDPEHKHIRDRIHTGHAFRPPSEYIMPSQSFFESRSSSQWTLAEDDELRRIVKEYSYNWSLISSCMTLPSMFSSGAERRTPWECFERWISLEGLPVEMAKINYFRAYHARLQAAQKTVENHQLAQQQQQGGGAAQLPLRRRTTQPYSVERRKEQRHLHLIDAMRKLAKKRETALNKQQHGTFPPLETWISA